VVSQKTVISIKKALFHGASAMTKRRPTPFPNQRTPTSSGSSNPTQAMSPPYRNAKSTQNQIVSDPPATTASKTVLHPKELLLTNTYPHSTFREYGQFLLDILISSIILSQLWWPRYIPDDSWWECLRYNVVMPACYVFWFFLSTKFMRWWYADELDIFWEGLEMMWIGEGAAGEM